MQKRIWDWCALGLLLPVLPACGASDGAAGSNGTDGASALVSIVEEPAGAHCDAGGKKIEYGADTSGDGTLDANEVEGTEYICDGAQGTPGDTGLTGDTGPAGETGPAGKAGPSGKAGAAGKNGTDGAPGVAGPAGAMGDTGPVGAMGDPGATGATGAIGAPGATGATGPAGATGAPGATGATGPAGAIGSPGAPGATGPAGAVGAPGARGAAGPAGATGPAGNQGNAGYNSLISTSIEASGANCVAGGLMISVGIDNGDGLDGVAGDSVLQAGEVDQTSYLCTPYVPKRVFVSGSWAHGDMGGLAGADAFCQSRANSVGLGGAYKAWLSDATASPSTRFSHSALPYALVDGTQIAANWTALTSGRLSNPINLTATGVVYNDYVFSATNADGTYFGSDDCDGWTSSASAGIAMVGYSPDQNQWSHVGLISCDGFQAVYCFEQ